MQKLFSEKEDGYIREQMDLLESICEANDIKFSELGNYGEALLTTPLEYWKVRLPNNSTNPYKLYHKSKLHSNAEWHRQIVSNLSVEEIVIYIKEHGKGKYGNGMEAFSITDRSRIEPINSKVNRNSFKSGRSKKKGSR